MPDFPSFAKRLNFAGQESALMNKAYPVAYNCYRQEQTTAVLALQVALLAIALPILVRPESAKGMFE